MNTRPTLWLRIFSLGFDGKGDLVFTLDASRDPAQSRSRLNMRGGVMKNGRRIDYKMERRGFVEMWIGSSVALLLLVAWSIAMEED